MASPTVDKSVKQTVTVGKTSSGKGSGDNADILNTVMIFLQGQSDMTKKEFVFLKVKLYILTALMATMILACVAGIMLLREDMTTVKQKVFPSVAEHPMPTIPVAPMAINPKSTAKQATAAKQATNDR